MSRYNFGNYGRQLERAEEENDNLQEAGSGTFSNGDKVESTFDKYASGKSNTVNNLLEKLSNMEGKFSRLEKSHAKCKCRLDKGVGSGGGGGSGDGDDNHNEEGGGKTHKKKQLWRQQNRRIRRSEPKPKPRGKRKL